MQEKEKHICIGLEVHIQLATKRKLFGPEARIEEQEANTNVSPYSAGYPGTLPVLNRKALDYGFLLALSCGCKIPDRIGFARKNYFYPDLPKSYQITQEEEPLGIGGYITIISDGNSKKIGLKQIHLEEDAGKTIYKDKQSMVDLNRCGIPLIEIVSNPEINSANEAISFVNTVRTLCRYLGISEGKMEKGNLRCDLNISLSGANGKKGIRTEIKNLNSLHSIRKAIELETKRQQELLSKAQKISAVTLGYDSQRNKLVFQRHKEDKSHYRYFHDPDLGYYYPEREYIQTLKSCIPELPEKKYHRLIDEYKLHHSRAEYLYQDPETAAFFEKLASKTNSVDAANWILGPLTACTKELNSSISCISLHKLAELINLVSKKKLSRTAAISMVLPKLYKQPELDIMQFSQRNNLLINDDQSKINFYIDNIISQNKNEYERYCHGEKKLIGFFMGLLMKKTNYKSDPKHLKKLLEDKLRPERKTGIKPDF